MTDSLPYVLRETLKSRNPDLGNETEAMIQNVTPLLWHTLSTFPSGTSHTPLHTTTVEHIAGMLLPSKLLRQLTDDEIQLLVLACHFHDLGMAGTEFDNESHETRDLARRDHAIRIGEIIKEKWAELQFRNTTLAELLAEICRGHRPEKSDGRAIWDGIYPNRIIAPGRAVRLRSVCALIYAADELHIGSDRAPQREQDWLQIANEESRRHWQRHQMLNGPAVIGEEICFEARPSSLVVEDDLRKQVFRKAFSSVRDAITQLAADGFEGTLPRLRVQWLREEVWQLLLLRTQSDHNGRTVEELLQNVKQLYSAESSTSDDLDDLPVNAGTSDAEITAEIQKTIRDFRLRERLVLEEGTSEKVLLSIDPRTARHFFNVTRRADKRDVLVAGPYASHHEFDLLRSPYGRRFAERSLIPIVEAGFGVYLATEHEESPVLEVLQASPTATQLLTDFTPAPSVLVKRHLLRLAVLTGASLDLLRSPELMLDVAFRHATRRVAQEVAAGQPDFLGLIEELALVGGYSYEHVHDAIRHSDAEMREFENAAFTTEVSSNGPQVPFHITQNIPTHLPATSVSFPYLFLAGARAGVTVELVNTREAPFKINFETDTAQQVPDLPPARISIGPGKPTFPGRVDMRASFTFDEAARVGELLLHQPDDNDGEDLPIIIGLPVAVIKAGGGTAKTQIDYYWPAVTVELLDALDRMVDVSEHGDAEWQMVTAKDRRILGTQRFAKEEASNFIPRPFERQLLDFLRSISSKTPLPWFIPDEELAELENEKSDKRRVIYDKYSNMNVDAKHKVTSVRLVTAAVDGRGIREEFLGFFPGGMFGPPAIDETGGSSQEELNRKWENPTEPITLGASYANDHYELAREIRQWAEDRTKPFPLNVTSGAPDSPIFKTQFELVNCPHVDRLWYVECPVVMRLRPIRSVEQWRVEARYWESIGEQGRASLLRERIDQLDKTHTAKTESAKPGCEAKP